MGPLIRNIVDKQESGSPLPTLVLALACAGSGSVAESGKRPCRRFRSVDQNPIYLDHNATTPVLPEVVDAMLPYLREHFGNPSSRHIYGRRAHDAIERARCAVAGLIGGHADEIIFTSGSNLT